MSKQFGPKGPSTENVKAKDIKATSKKLIAYCKNYLGLIIVSCILAIVASVLAVIGPNMLKELTNTISSGLLAGIDFDKVINITLTLCCIYLASSTFMALQNIFMAKVSQNTAKKMRNDIISKVNSVPIKYVDSHSHGDLLSRTTNDVDTVSQGLNNTVATLVHSVALLVATLIMMFISNWILALSTILCSVIGFAIIIIIMKNSQKYFASQQDSLGKLDGHVAETYSGHNIIKLYNATDEESQKFEAINSKLYDSGLKSQFYGGLMMPIMNFIGNFNYVVVCVIGAILVSKNMTDIGTIVAFIMYARMFSNQLSQMSQSFMYLQSTLAASERIFEFLGQQNELDYSGTNKLDANTVKGDVSFKNVCFGYVPQKRVINDFSINIKSGQKVAIVGETGAGKTTIVNLLMKFYDVESGDICIDGISTKELTRGNVHNLFGMVLQDTWLFDGTLKQNLVFNKQDVSNKTIDDVCNACGLTHFINTLPNGYDTVLDDNTTVSIGQKQLLTIARAMIQNSPMIILDEATSNVDTKTEVVIQKAMDQLSKGRTSFVIAHRLSTIKNADVIIVMDKGQIVETGNHSSLIAKNGVYAKLYNSQFENV